MDMHVDFGANIMPCKVNQYIGNFKSVLLCFKFLIKEIIFKLKFIMRVLNKECMSKHNLFSFEHID